MNRQQQIRTRRRITFTVGVLTMSLTGVAAAAFGSGCIFDEGGYDGGGRRTGAPTASDSLEPPPDTTPTSTSTSTSTPNDSGSQPQDADSRDN